MSRSTSRERLCAIVLVTSIVFLGLPACDKVADSIVKVKIVKPVGSAKHGDVPQGANGANSPSWVMGGPFHFDFQWVKKPCRGNNGDNDIEGRISSSILTYPYFWEVGEGKFKNHDMNPRKPKEKTGTATPTYEAVTVTASAGVDLRLSAIMTDLQGNIMTDAQGNKMPLRTVEKKIIVYEDHLARDYDNFGVGKSCKGNWTFAKYGVTIKMNRSWDCHGSTWHAFDGSGNGYNQHTPVNFPTKIPYSPPIDWAAVAAQLKRGDVVVFFSGSPGNFIPQHSHTCLSGTSMYAANNEPKVDFTKNQPDTWMWDVCTSHEYFFELNKTAIEQLGDPLITMIEVRKKP